MQVKGYEDGEEIWGLGLEESRRDEWDGNSNEVECCWEDVAVIEGCLIASESALKSCNKCCKVGRDCGFADEGEFIEILEIWGVDWIVDSSATSSWAGFFWWAKFDKVSGQNFDNATYLHPSEGLPSQSRLDLLMLDLCQDGYCLDWPKWTCSFFQTKAGQKQELLVCHYLVSVLWHPFVLLYDEMSHCSCSLLLVHPPIWLICKNEQPLVIGLFVKFLSRKSPCNSKTACQEFGISLLLYCSM